MSKRGCSPIPRLTAHMGRYLLLLLGLGLAVYVLLPQTAVFERSLQVLQTMQWWAVGLALLGQVLSFFGSGYLITATAAIFGHRLSLVRSTVIFTAAGSIGLLGGGLVGNTAATYRWLRGSGVNAEGAVIAGWMPVLLGNALLVLISILGLTHLIAVHELTTLQAVGFGLVLLLLFVVTGVALWGTRHRAQLTGLFVRVSGWWARLRRRPPDPALAQEAVNQLFSAWYALRAGGWRGALLGETANLVFDMSTLYLLFVAAGQPISPGILLAGYGLPQLLGRLSFLLPGGVGIIEGTMAVMYVSLGIPNAVAVVVVLVYRFLSFWLPGVVGFPLTFYLEHIMPEDQRDLTQSASGESHHVN